MNAPQRFVHLSLGDLVRFADVEEALRDSTRLKWLLPVIAGSDEDLATRRTSAIFRAMSEGHAGIALVDAAMAVCPE